MNRPRVKVEPVNTMKYIRYTLAICLARCEASSMNDAMLVTGDVSELHHYKLIKDQVQITKYCFKSSGSPMTRVFVTSCPVIQRAQCEEVTHARTHTHTHTHTHTRARARVIPQTSNQSDIFCALPFGTSIISGPCYCCQTKPCSIAG